MICVFVILLCLNRCVAAYDYEVVAGDFHTTTIFFAEDDEKPPRLWKKNIKVVATQGSAISLHCKVIEGDEPITIHWEFVSDATQKFQSLNGGGPTLSFKSVQHFQAGKYTCIAENDAGNDKHTIELVVQSRKPKGGNVRLPMIFKKQKVIETSLGNLLLFGCKLIEGSPDARIRWQFRNIDSSEFAEIRPPILNDPFVTNKFIIKSVKTKHLGSYKCIAENKYGRDEHIFKVTVKAAASKPPQIDKTSKLVKATEGFPTALNCKVVGGDPATKIKWQFKKRNSKMVRSLKTEGGAFIINSVRNDHAGFYKCIAENEAGHDAHTFQLTVQNLNVREKQNSDDNSDSDRRPVIHKYIRTAQLKTDFPMALFCNVIHGKTGTSIKWLFKKSKTHEFRYLNFKKTPFVIPAVQLKHAGTYRCIAENEAGNDIMDIELTVMQALENNEKQIQTLTDGNQKISNGNNTNGKIPLASQCKGPISRHGDKYEKFYSIYSKDRRQIETGPNVLLEMHIAILAAQDGHILLSATANPNTTTPVYEIVVGCAWNTFTDLRRNIKRNPKQSVKTSAILSPVEFRPFYIRISKDGLIEFGKEGESPILRYYDLNLIPVKYFSFGAWHGIEAKFLYDCPVNAPTTKPPTIKPPTIEKKKTKIKSAVGFPTALACKVIAGDPVITIKWQFHDYKTTEYHDLNFHSTPLMIASAQPSDGGFYRCVAENGGGNDTHVVELGVPDFMKNQMHIRINDTGDMIEHLLVQTDTFGHLISKDDPISKDDTIECILAKNHPTRSR